MGKPKLIFATLIPQDPTKRNELKCITRILKEWDSVKDNYESLKIIIGSAHQESLNKAREVLRMSLHDFAVDIINAEFVYCPFKMHPLMSEIRAHEIGFSKRFLHQYIMDRCYSDFLYWIDSDMYIPFKEVHICALRLTHSSFFITLPYCVRDGMSAPPEQFGAYVMNTSMLTPDTLKTMYQTDFKQKTICRIGAPDCKFKEALIIAGGQEIRADEIYSEHYSDDEKTEDGKRYVFIYSAGSCKRKVW